MKDRQSAERIDYRTDDFTGSIRLANSRIPFEKYNLKGGRKGDGITNSNKKRWKQNAHSSVNEIAYGDRIEYCQNLTQLILVKPVKIKERGEKKTYRNMVFFQRFPIFQNSVQFAVAKGTPVGRSEIVGHIFRISQSWTYNPALPPFHTYVNALHGRSMDIFTSQ